MVAGFCHKIWLLYWKTEVWAVHSMSAAVAMWHVWENRDCSQQCQGAASSSLCGQGKSRLILISLPYIMSARQAPTTDVRHQTTIQNGLRRPMACYDRYRWSGQSGCGVVVCDHQGVLLAANWCLFDHIQSPEMAEAHAVRQALIFANKAEFQTLRIAFNHLRLIIKVQKYKCHCPGYQACRYRVFIL